MQALLHWLHFSEPEVAACFKQGKKSPSCRRCGYLSDDGCAVVLGPEGGGITLVGSGAASITPATFRHPRRQQTGGTGGQLITARANQRDLSDLGKEDVRKLVVFTNAESISHQREMDKKKKPVSLLSLKECICNHLTKEHLCGLGSCYGSEMNTKLNRKTIPI